jgi:glutaredoxin
MKKLIVFTLNGCSHCDSLKKRLSISGFPFTEIEVSNNKTIWDQVVEQTGHNLLPTIYITQEDSDEGMVFVPGRDHKNEDEAIQIVEKYIIK